MEYHSGSSSESLVVLVVAVKAEVAGFLVSARTRIVLWLPVADCELHFLVKRSGALASSVREYVLSLAIEVINLGVGGWARLLLFLLLEASSLVYH